MASPAVIQITMARKREAAANQQHSCISSASGGRRRASGARYAQRYSERCARVAECHESTCDCHYRSCFCKKWSPCPDQPKRCAGCGHGAMYHDSAPVAEHRSLTLQEKSQGNATGQELQGNDACEIVIVEEPRDVERVSRLLTPCLHYQEEPAQQVLHKDNNRLRLNTRLTSACVAFRLNRRLVSACVALLL